MRKIGKRVRRKRCFSHYSDFDRVCRRCPLAEECMVAMVERVLLGKNK